MVVWCWSRGQVRGVSMYVIEFPQAFEMLIACCLKLITLNSSNYQMFQFRRKRLGLLRHHPQ